MSSKVMKDGRELLPEEVDFDKKVYGGISYFGQAISGSALTYWIRHASGRPIFDKMANWAGPNFISKITKMRGAAAIKEADSWITVGTMVMMGNLFLLPVKWLENRKAEIIENKVHENNAAREARGEHLTPEEKAHQDKLLQDLKDAPKVSWWSLGVGRAVALVGVFGGRKLIGQANNEAMEKATIGAFQKTADFVGLKSVAKSKPVGNAVGIAFYDGFYSAISASGLYLYSQFLGRTVNKLIGVETGKKPESAPEVEPQQEAAPAPHTAPQEPVASHDHKHDHHDKHDHHHRDEHHPKPRAVKKHDTHVAAAAASQNQHATHLSI